MKLNRSKTARFFTWLGVAMIALAVVATPVLAMSANGPVEQPVLDDMTPDYFAEILLGLAGAALSLVFKYVPKAKSWFESFAHQGVLMLGIVVLFGGVYLALACTPYAAQLGIQLACGEASLFVLLKAIFIIASGNQLAY